MTDNIKNNALVKLAQTRLAINYILRARAMQKQARDPDWMRNLEMTDEMNGAVGISTPQWVRGMGGTLNKARTIERYKTPENAPTSYFWPLNKETNSIKGVQKKTKRMQQQRDPKKIEENKKWEGPH